MLRLARYPMAVTPLPRQWKPDCLKFKPYICITIGKPTNCSRILKWVIHAVFGRSELDNPNSHIPPQNQVDKMAIGRIKSDGAYSRVRPLLFAASQFAQFRAFSIG